MSRQSFRETNLGPWSSHPAYIAERTRKWAMLCALPLVCGIAFFVFLWRFGAVTLLSLARDWNTWLPLVLALVAFGFAAAVTVLLVSRASTIGTFQEAGGRPEASGWTKDPMRLWTIAIGTGLVSILAFLLTRSGSLSQVMSADAVATLRLIGHLTATGPVFCLLVYLEWHGAAVDLRGKRRPSGSYWQLARRAFSVVGILAGYVLPMMWIDRLASALDLYLEHLKDPALVSADSVVDRILRWVPFLSYDKAAPGASTTPILDALDGAQELLSALALMLPLGCMTFFVMATALTFIASAKPEEEPISPDEVTRREGYDLRPTGECWDPNGDAKRPTAPRWRPIPVPADAEAEEPEAEDAGNSEPAPPGPEWLASLKQAAGGPGLVWGEARRAGDRECSAPSSRADLGHLFATAVDPESGVAALPTADQVGALEQFDRLLEEFLGAEDREGRCVFPSMDLLVTGGPGSGRTTLLLAAAMNSVVLRGQSVLILVPTHEKVDLVIARLRDLASRGGVGWHVAVGPIRNDDVRRWADSLDELEDGKVASRFRSPIGSLPDILVGTPQDYERHLFGADHHAPVVRRALLRLQVVLVEDVTTFTAEERRHLPFLLDKHRLVLASEHLPVQFMALAPDLSEQAGDYLVERLFTERKRVPCARLRPPRRPAPWVVDVAAEGPDEVLQQIARAASSSELQVVWWRPEATSSDRKKLSALLSGARGGVQVVGDLDELSPEDALAVDLAVYRSATARQQTLALAGRLGHGESLLLRLTSAAGMNARPAVERALPVVPSVEAETLFVAHLASAVRFLGARSPMPRDLLARLGFGATGDLVGVPRRDARFASYPGYSFLLDPAEPQAERVAAARGQTWAWVALWVDADGRRTRLPMPAARPVELLRPLASGRQLRGDSRVERLYLGESPVAEQSMAAWSTQQGESLDRMDLAYADSLLHRHGAEAFFPVKTERDASGMLIKGAPYKGRGSAESFLPVWDVKISVPASTRLLLDQSGAVPTALRWGELREPIDAAVAIDSQFWLRGTFDECGNETPASGELPIHYPTRVSVWLLGMARFEAAVTQAEREERTRLSMLGDWLSGRPMRGQEALRSRPWPVLGMALTAALRDALPALMEYARIAAFRGVADRVNDDRAFVFFVEPAGTRGTVGAAMRKLLLDVALLRQVLVAAQRRLDDVALVDGDAYGNLMVEAGVVVGSGWYSHDAEGDRALAADCRDGRQLLQSILDEIRDPSGPGTRGRARRPSRPDEVETAAPPNDRPAAPSVPSASAESVRQDWLATARRWLSAQPGTWPRLDVAGASDPVDVAVQVRFEGNLHQGVVRVDRAMVEAARRVEHVVWHETGRTPGDPHRGLLLSVVLDPLLAPFYDAVLLWTRSLRDRLALDRDRYLELLTAWVQQIEYDADADHDPRYPVEVVFDGRGDCDETSLLLAALLSIEGYGCALLSFERERHMAVGVVADGLHLGATAYAMIETTGLHAIGGLSVDRIAAFHATPTEVVPLGDGPYGYGATDEVRRLHEAAATSRAEVEAMDKDLAAREARLQVLQDLVGDLRAAAEAAPSDAVAVGAHEAAVARCNKIAEELAAAIDRRNESAQRANRLGRWLDVGRVAARAWLES